MTSRQNRAVIHITSRCDWRGRPCGGRGYTTPGLSSQLDTRTGAHGRRARRARGFEKEKTNMRITKAALFLFGIFVLAGALMGTRADTFDKKTQVTFNNPVEV